MNASEGNTVKMYTCGPTVYDFAHIGNFRTFVFYDLLRRWLRASGFTLDHVMNITDVDDKIIRNAVAQGKTLEEYTNAYTKAFLDDCATLRLERPERSPAPPNTSPKWPPPSTSSKRGPHLPQRRLGLLPHREPSRLRQALAQRFQRHGRRRARRRRRIRKGRRPRLRPLESAQTRRARLGYRSRHGPPRLAHRVLRDGDSVPRRNARHPRRRRRSDLSAPRKRDRAVGIAHRQAEFARFWVHSEFLLVDGQKMSKSLGNFYTLRDSSRAASRRKRCAICWRRCLIAKA
jgi:cysteinyl-tRNA synthetase